MDLVAVGTVAFDNVETPWGRAERIVGGACTYIALAASYLTRPIGIVSVIGDDFPGEMLQEMGQRGIDLQGVQVKSGEKSFFWSGRYHRDLNTRDTLDTQLNVLASFDPVLPPNYRQPAVLMLGNLTPAVQLRVLDQLDERPGAILLDTMNFWMDTALDDLKKVLMRIDILTINDEEARQLSGEHSLVRAAQIIHDMGPKTLVIKKGEHGALVFQAGEVFFAPALPLADVIDPTGAGDTFAGGLAGYLARTKDFSFNGIRRAVIFGSALASFVVEKFGVEGLLHLEPEQITDRVQQFARLVHVEHEAEFNFSH